MTFIESITTCFKKSFSIKGRACRSEFWWFQLLYSASYLIIIVTADTFESLSFFFIGILIITIIPLLTATIRRLHDVDKSGFFIFWSIVPIIGSFIVLFALMPEGTKGKNQFGKNPLKK